MGQDLIHPYIRSTTMLCDTSAQEEVDALCQKMQNLKICNMVECSLTTQLNRRLELLDRFQCFLNATLEVVALESQLLQPVQENVVLTQKMVSHILVVQAVLPVLVRAEHKMFKLLINFFQCMDLQSQALMH